MAIETTRRRLLALVALAIGTRSAWVQFANAQEPQPTEGVRDVGGWHIVSIANNSTATVLDDRIRVAGVSAELGHGGGSAKIAMQYWSLDGGAFSGTISIGVAGALMSGFQTHVLVDGAEVDTFRTDGSETRDLTAYFGKNLTALPDAKNIKVVIDVGDDSVTIYDAALEGTSDAFAAMKLIPDYSYNVRGLGNPAAGGPPGGQAPSGSGPGSCFITTACCTMVGLPDDCVELSTLRRFRDQVMARTPEGRNDIARYYALAPAILAEITRRGDGRRLLWVYFRYILPSAAAARLGLDAVAQRLYTRMMYALAHRYLAPAALH